MLAVTLSLGLGVTSCLLLVICRVCRLYTGSRGAQPPPAHPQPGVDLDSEAVDWDINTTLYTPLPEPKIMQIAGAGDGNLDTVSTAT